jgi:branched-chain amino acid transport system permease protein
VSARVASGTAALAVLIALPAILSSYQLGLVTKMLIFGIFAMSLDLLLGYAGLPSLGHAAYFGVAAYTVGLLHCASPTTSGSTFRRGWPWPPP